MRYKKILHEIVISGSALFCAWAVTGVLKILIHAPRPFVVLGLPNSSGLDAYASFPSAHSTFFFALATVVFIHNKYLGYLFFILAIIVGISRVVIGVHYPIDVLAGAVIGMVVAWGIHRLLCQPYLFPQKPVK